MHSVTHLAKRLFASGSLLLLAACGTNGITDPTADRSANETVSASTTRVGVTSATGKTVITVTAPVKLPVKPLEIPETNSGYNVPAF